MTSLLLLLLPVVAVLLVLTSIEAVEHRGCARRTFGGDSFVCVCSATYCDGTVRSDDPVRFADRVLLYTTSKDEHRLTRSTVAPQPDGSRPPSTVPALSIRIDPSRRRQTIEGFGGSFTDATGINIRSLDRRARRKLLEAYFADTGLEYNLGRVPIGGSDFSTRPYSYDDDADGDFRLERFRLQPEDYLYKIPIIEEARRLSSGTLRLVATSWSPPTWMKTPERFNGSSVLKTADATGNDYYQTYADYHVRFLEEYAKLGVSIWALTSQNEPYMGLRPDVTINGLGFTPRTLSTFVRRYLSPTLRKSTFGNVTKLLVYDFDRKHVLAYMAQLDSGVFDSDRLYDGIALHWYADKVVTPLVLDVANALYPRKPLLVTEACIINAFRGNGSAVDLGSWYRADQYAYYIIQNLQHWVTGWIDWNMVLDLEGGPSWAQNYVDAPIIVDSKRKVFYKQPMFYVMGHFSKFIRPGSVVVDATHSKNDTGLSSVAVLTPNSDLILVVLNRNANPVEVQIKSPDRRFVTTVPSKAIQTYILKKNNDEKKSHV